MAEAPAVVFGERNLSIAHNTYRGALAAMSTAVSWCDGGRTSGQGEPRSSPCPSSVRCAAAARRAAHPRPQGSRVGDTLGYSGEAAPRVGRSLQRSNAGQRGRELPQNQHSSPPRRVSATVSVVQLGAGERKVLKCGLGVGILLA